MRADNVAEENAIPRAELRKKIIESLEHQGFTFEGARLRPPPLNEKHDYRTLHAASVRHKLDVAKKSFVKIEQDFLAHIASGCEVVPSAISPRLDSIERKSFDELLFRYIRLHWSIPVSAGYGRRLRFIVRDESNNKVIGILGLCDPVYALSSRDNWIGWTYDQKKSRLYNVMDAFVLGAVPPYSQLLCGKFVALLTQCKEIREAFSVRYSGNVSMISHEMKSPSLALVTTTSALGKSSLYSRLKTKEEAFLVPVGYTKGSGEFHFLNGLYEPMLDYVMDNCQPKAKHPSWGKGYRNRREVIKLCLKELGLPTELVYHGINREVFVAPLARNSAAFLRGETNSLDYYDRSVTSLFSYFRQRWLLPRAGRDESYRGFQSGDYALWT